MRKKKLMGKAICPNCKKEHFTNGKKVSRKCQCSYYISHSDFTEIAYK